MTLRKSATAANWLRRLFRFSFNRTERWTTTLHPAATIVLLNRVDSQIASPNIAYVNHPIRGVSPPARLRSPSPCFLSCSLRNPCLGQNGIRRQKRAIGRHVSPPGIHSMSQYPSPTVPFMNAPPPSSPSDKSEALLLLTGTPRLPRCDGGGSFAESPSGPYR